jgi:hypothetical protein
VRLCSVNRFRPGITCSIADLTRPAPVGPALRSASDPARAPACVPAADVLPRDTESASDLGLGAAGGEQLAGLETDTFEGLAVTQAAALRR